MFGGSRDGFVAGRGRAWKVLALFASGAARETAGGGRGGGKGGFVRTRAFYGEPTPHRRRARGGGGARRGISRILGETLLLVTRVADSKLDGIC